MQKIYIVLTSTGTILSRLIRLYTGDEFSHVSISLDKNLTQMYSFGRIYPHNPFIGGFIHEYINKGTFKRFNKTRTAIFSLEITDKEYQIIKEILAKMKRERHKYTFNILGLFAVALGKNIKKENSFYCAEFVKYIMNEAQIEHNLPQIVRPENFKDLKRTNKIYWGLLKEYK